MNELELSAVANEIAKIENRDPNYLINPNLRVEPNAEKQAKIQNRIKEYRKAVIMIMGDELCQK